MTIVSNDPTWWPSIDAYRFASYFAVAAFVGVMYDWALTFGQEVELIWRQRWSLMTFLYLSVRYLGILYAVLAVLSSVPTIPLTDTDWTSTLIFPMLWVIMITRLHAMYQRSRNMLIFLIVTFLADNIFNGVVIIMTTMHASGEELILSGTYQCSIGCAKDGILLISITWILATVWEVLALCLAVWIAVKHFRELRQHSAGGIIGDCFTVVEHGSFVAVSSSELIINFSPTISEDLNPIETRAFYGLLQILNVVQMFVLGPRLILGVREYHAKLMADSDAVSGMTSIAFQERMHILTGHGV
ncbi:uncharacterized protein HD556DRAFT_1503986 [Suillus plorans]|uniref:DUF6533 domain-containing protein n=1 Tax=Suillus plorans TaxID=116603 RepID=A0A9P7DBW7_9AGAM|nr:uncharacterized protein HD556DRAFT_1503986 [Suillus plorans]KAG1787068.1 hypothetical protein HD556DRAFT_1503986 [Suillus plorans]